MNIINNVALFLFFFFFWLYLWWLPLSEWNQIILRVNLDTNQKKKLTKKYIYFCQDGWTFPCHNTMGLSGNGFLSSGLLYFVFSHVCPALLNS